MANIIRKGLNFDFEKIGEQNTTIDPIINFSRSSTATRINPTSGLVESVAANVPRINGRQELWKAGSKNLLQYSNDFNKAPWQTLGAGFTYIKTRDDFTMVNSLDGDSYLYQRFTPSTSGQYTLSLDMKAPTTDGITLLFYTGDFVSILGQVGINPTPTSTRYSVTATLTAGVQYCAVLGGGWSQTETKLIRNWQLELSATATDYEPNPVIIEPGLLIEESKTNLISNSNPLFGGGWGSNNWPVITSGAAISPDGTQNATYISGSGTNDLYCAINGINNLTTSVWIKPITDYIVNFGVLSHSGGGYVPTTKYLSAGWNRIFNTGNVGSAPGWVIQYFNSISGAFYLYGAQMETGNFPTSYIPTNGSVINRAADVATVDVSKLWNAQEGTIICEVDFGPLEGGTKVALDGNYGNRVLIRRRPETSYAPEIYLSWAGETQTVSWQGPTPVTRARFAITYRPESVSVSVNGGPVTTLAASGAPATTTLFLGAYADNSNHLNGTIQQFLYLPYALDDYTLKPSSELK